MRITVRLLASYRRYLPDDHDEQAGYGLEIAEQATVGDLLAELALPADEPTTLLVNGQHATRDHVLRDGDAVALFPAVGGG